MSETWISGNDHLLDVTGLTAAIDGSAVNDATVTVTVTDNDGAEVTGATWPLAVPYVAGSSGNYQVALPDTLGLAAGRQYRAAVVADGGAGRRFTRAVLFWVKDGVV